MRVKEASIKRECRYERWYPLLCEELKLVTLPNARIIPIGSHVDRFLTEKNLPPLTERILHYSQSAARYRRKTRQLYPEKYVEFLKSVS